MEALLVDDVPAAFAVLVTDRAPRSMALSGGTTARECYDAVALRGHDWSVTTFWFGDERFVPVADADSNEGMARGVWLDRTSTGEIHSLATAGPTPETAARNYEAQLRAADVIDLVHLGLGPDGHTASLFPGSPFLSEADRWVVAAGDVQHPHARLTFTFGALAAVRQIVVTVAGAEKHTAFAQVRAGDLDLPASHLVTDPTLADKTVWLVDRAAAGLLDIPR